MFVKVCNGPGLHFNWMSKRLLGDVTNYSSSSSSSNSSIEKIGTKRQSPVTENVFTVADSDDDDDTDDEEEEEEENKKQTKSNSSSSSKKLKSNTSQKSK